MNTVHVAFLGMDSDLALDVWANRAAACLSNSKIIHCEVILPRRGEAMSIMANGKVFIHNKKFSRVDWEFRSVRVTRAQEDALYAFAASAVDRPFNWWGYYLLPLGGVDGDKTSYFCSELCAHALQSMGLFPRLVPHKTTPGGLMAAMSQSDTCVKTGHPTRMYNDLSL
jgi:hypothetical protein